MKEVVTEYLPPYSKTWETRGEPRLLVIGPYRMGFVISPRVGGSLVKVFIDYRLPERGCSRLFGRLLGDSYAGWCTRRMTQDAVESFRNATVS